MSDAPVLNYTIINLGNGYYDFRPEPTMIRFDTPKKAKEFIDNLTNNRTVSTVTLTKGAK